MKMRRIALGLLSVVVTSSIAFVGCVPEKKKSSVSQTTMEQNALDAEQAELELAHADATANHDQKYIQKTDVKKAASAKSVKTVKTEKTAKANSKSNAKTAVKSTRNPASYMGAYVVQVGAFRVKENAERLNTKLQGSGYKSNLTAINHSKNGSLYIVHLEPAPTRAEADQWASKLKSDSFDTQVVRK
ncbi:MAG: SPOR domain-containing protein [Bdellovibrionota bacterium]